MVQQVKDDSNKFQGENIIQTYYDAFSPEVEASDEELQRAMLTFGPFPEAIPDFAWSKAFMEPKKRPYHWSLVNNAQLIMRNLLFRNVHWETTKRALDFGCGYGADLSRIAVAHDKLKLDGYTLSSHQQSIGLRLAKYYKCEDRINIYHRDSSKIEFPNTYDLVFGFEVAHHVPDKPALFGNVGRNIRAGGHLVMADFISNLHTSIDHHASSSFFVTLENWVELLSSNGLRITNVVDISSDVSNMLYDPQFEQNMKEINKIGFTSTLNQTEDEVIASFHSYDGLCRALGTGVATYMLLDAVRDDHTMANNIGYYESLCEHNRSRLEALVPFAKVDSAAWTQRIDWDDAPLGVIADNDYETKSRVIVYGDDFNGKLKAALPQSMKFDYVEYGDRNKLEECIGVRDDKTVHIVFTPESLITNMSVSGDVVLVCDAALKVVKSVSENAITGAGNIRVWFALSQKPGDNRHNTIMATLCGLTRVIAIEMPEIGISCVTYTTGDVQALSAELIADDSNTFIDVCGGVRKVARLRHLPVVGWLNIPNVKFNATKIYVVSGGSGGIGRELISWMKTNGASKIVNISRSGSHIDGVVSISGNIGKLADVKKALSNALNTFSGAVIGGIFHLAGVTKDALLPAQTKESLHTVIDPKVAGAWNLHIVSQSLKHLDHFVMFSSGAASVGNIGQANYAAANAFMDDLARRRKADGLPGLSIGWGPWAGSGMAAGVVTNTALWPIAPNTGLETLGKLMHLDVSNIDLGDGQVLNGHISIISCNWALLPKYVLNLPYFESKRHVMKKLQNRIQVDKAGDERSYTEIELLKSSLDEASLLLYLQKKAAMLILDSDSDSEDDEDEQYNLPDADSYFDDIGIDSLLTIELMNRLNIEFGISLSPTVIMANPCIREVVKQILKEIMKSTSTDVETKTKVEVAQNQKTKDNNETGVDHHQRLDSKKSVSGNLYQLGKNCTVTSRNNIPVLSSSTNNPASTILVEKPTTSVSYGCNHKWIYILSSMFLIGMGAMNILLM